MYRIVQEALTNVLKHAQAAQVAVRLRFDEQRTTLEVQDDGVGFEPAAERGGFGLQNIRERAERVGGTVYVESAPGAGTTVRVEVATDGA